MLPGRTFSVNGQSILPVTISVGGSYSFDLGFTPADGLSSYSGRIQRDGRRKRARSLKVSISGVGVGDQWEQFRARL